LEKEREEKVGFSYLCMFLNLCFPFSCWGQRHC